MNILVKLVALLLGKRENHPKVAGWDGHIAAVPRRIELVGPGGYCQLD
jgi:hypothetical protein